MIKSGKVLFTVLQFKTRIPPFHLIKWLGHADIGMVMHCYKLHDEESLWTMKKVSIAETKQAVESAEVEAV